MKGMTKLLVALILLLTVLSPQTSARAGGGGDTYRFRAQGAHASFSSTDPSGCIVTEVNLSGDEEFLQVAPGPGETASGVFVSISQYDSCTDTALLAAQGFTLVAEPDVQVAKKLEWATLNSTVNVFDSISETYFDVTLNVTWTSNSSIDGDNFISHSLAPHCNILFRTHGKFRSAEATGSVSDGVTEFVSGPSWDAAIFSVKNGRITGGCDS